MTYRACNRGFTLLELSIVLIIIAIVTGMSMEMGVSVVATARLTTTQKKMKIIEEALLAFRTANDRIPCPGDLTIAQGAANLGIEAATPGTCTGGSPTANFTSGTAVEGALPAITLKLPADFMVDGWGNRFRYAVDTAMTAVGAFSSTPLGANCGPITVNDASGSARSTKAMYALISHGANGHGAYTKGGAASSTNSVNANELVNCHCNSSGVATAYSPTYVQMDATQDPANDLNSFDDFVVYKERWQFRTDWDTAGGSCTVIYVADYGNNRVEKFDANGNYIGQWGSVGTGHGQFSNPSGIAVDASSNVYVAVFYNSRVEKFDADGNYLSTIGSQGSGNGQIWNPSGVTVDSSGNIYVVDYSNIRVVKFDSSGHYVMKFGSPGSGDGQFNGVSNIAVDPSGNIWVTDSFNFRIQKFDSNGNFLLKFGSAGSGNGQFWYPISIVADSSGYVYVTDDYVGRIEKFDNSGNYVSTIGSYGNGDGQFAFATGLALDSNNKIYGGDGWNYRVEKFDSNGNFLLKFGSQGAGNGQVSGWFFAIAVSGR